jgi:hypothetical protein
MTFRVWCLYSYLVHDLLYVYIYLFIIANYIWRTREATYLSVKWQIIQKEQK